MVLLLLTILLVDAVAGTRLLKEQQPGNWNPCKDPKSVYVGNRWVTVCYKRRNNGTVSCHTFCTTSGWKHVYKKCYGGYDTANRATIDCDVVVDETRSAEDMLKEVICYCSPS